MTCGHSHGRAAFEARRCRVRDPHSVFMAYAPACTAAREVSRGSRLQSSDLGFRCPYKMRPRLGPDQDSSKPSVSCARPSAPDFYLLVTRTFLWRMGRSAVHDFPTVPPRPGYGGLPSWVAGRADSTRRHEAYSRLKEEDVCPSRVANMSQTNCAFFLDLISAGL